MNRLTIVTAAVLSALCAGAADLRELAFQVAMPAKESPKLDGVLDDECWKTAHVHSDYYEYLKPNPRRVTNTKTDCMIVYDAKGVYTGIRNWEDQVSKLRQNCSKDFQQSIWKDDCGEIFYDPDASGIGYYKFVVNSLGKYDTAWRMDGANMDENWVASGIKCAAKVFNDRWEVELFIPWSVFHNRPAPKPGDIWTFNHARFRFGALGWGRGFSTSAPGGSGYSANKFGYLYFSDGSKPDAKTVLALLEKKLNTLWGIMIDGKVYIHDLTGTHVSDLDAEKRKLEKEFLDRETLLKKEIEEMKRKDLARKLSDLRVSYTNEVAKYDASFASVKQFRELVDKVRILAYELKAMQLVNDPAKAEPIEMPLAGKYDLTPPEKFDGHNGWYRHNRIKNALVTPHLEWCPETIDEAPHALFMTGFDTTLREAIELEQRFAYKDPLFHPGGFGATGIYQDPLSHGTFLDKQAQFETLLSKKPGVTVLLGNWFNGVPAHYRYELLRRVRDEGMGLVVMCGGIDRLILNKLTLDAESERTIAALVPYACLPGARKPRRVQPGESMTEAKMSLYTFGKGRVAQIDFQNPGEWSLQWKAAFETRCAFVANLVRWAHGADPAAKIDFGTGRDREDYPARASFFTYEIDAGKGVVDSVRCRLRTTGNKVVSDETVPLAPGRNTRRIDLAALPAGDYYLDVIPKKGAKCDFAAVYPFSKESVLGSVTIDGTNNTVVAEGSAPGLTVRWENPAPGDGVMKYEIADHPYNQVRIKGETTFKKNARSATVRLPRREFETLAGVMKVEISAHGRHLASARKVIFFPNHRFDDYSMIVWGGLRRGAMAELFAPQLNDVMGYDNHLGEGGELSAVFNARAVPYITRVTLSGTTNGTLWSHFPVASGTNRAHSAELAKVRRNANCYRPEIRALFETNFTPRVKRCAPYGVCVYNLGDECNYSADIGFGDKIDDGYFFDFLRKRYGTIEKYNAAHKTSLRDFTEVKRMTTAEAKKAGDWPSWFDQMSYAAKMYSDTFQMCRAVIKKYDPKGRIGAEGSPPGNIDETVKNLEFWGPYGDVYLDEVLKSIAYDRVRGMWWGGYLRSTRDGFPGHQWEYLLTGRANADEWFACTPGATESSFSGDLTLAPYVQKMHGHHSQLKRGLASYMIRTPLRKDGFAIYYSWASGCATTLSDEFKAPSEGGRDIIRFCYRKGLEVTFVTPNTIDRLSRHKLIFLPGICVLSDKEIAAFKAFAKRGGKIYADAEPGVLDEFLAKRAEAPLKGLWTKYERGCDDKTYLGIVGTIGVRQREKVTGLPDEGLVLRVRERPEQKAVGFTTHAKNCGKAVTLDLGSEGWIYECDDGFVGRGSKVEIASLARPFKLYAQFKEEQKAPSFKLDKAETRQGDYVTVNAQKLRRGGVYRMCVIAPDGKAIANREKVFTVLAKPVDIKLQFPYSDICGTYSVVLRDIATGLEAKHDVKVVE